MGSRGQLVFYGHGLQYSWQGVFMVMDYNIHGKVCRCVKHAQVI